MVIKAMIVFKEHMMKHNALRLNIPLQLFRSAHIGHITADLIIDLLFFI